MSIPTEHLPRAFVSRRKFLAMLTAGTVVASGYSSVLVLAANRADTGGTELTGEEALKRLMEGNARYVAAKATHPNQTTERRMEVAKGQNPFAVILSCSDSRVPAEILFDQGLGDLFVLRTAGNVLADVVVGSIEYAVAELKVPLLMVLGHENCGAVKAAVSLVKDGAKFPGQINRLAELIAPAAKKAKDMPGDFVDNTVRLNAVMTAAELSKTEPILAEATKDKQLMVVAARYDLDEGRVEVLK